MPRSVLGTTPALTVAERAALVAQAKAALPPCYSRELDNCMTMKTPSVPGCDVIRAADDSDHSEIQKAMDDMPFCSGSREFTRGQALGLAGAGLVLGVVIGLCVK